MLNKRVDALSRALSVVKSGDTILVGGFGDIGVPLQLVHALAELDVRDLTLVSNNAGTGEIGLSRLFKNRQVSRVIASFPTQAGADHFKAAYERGEVQVELVPQGTLAERLRAGGSGVAAFFTPTAYGTELANGKEVRMIDGRGYVYERAIVGDVALVKARLADRYGNLRYRLASRNFNPLMAMAARHTIAEVTQIVDAGVIDPDDVHTPGVFVDQVVECGA
ncbi:MAG: 3-oxoadipate CoA-transferase [Rhizobiales bacterium 62-47]|jgi:3-oxoadipate CoA-transferase alpha subunit|nr:MAG: 3-oxoadipate CoA-transferase [Rhizobiales bacterium 62-47]